MPNLIIYLDPEYIEDTPSIDLVELPVGVPIEETVKKYINDNYFPIVPGSFVIYDPPCGKFATGGPDSEYDEGYEEEPYLSWRFDILEPKKMTV